jgi:hypothetical protein
MASLTVILYVPKVAKSKTGTKPHSKNVPRQFNTFKSSQRIKQNAMSIRVSSVDRSVPFAKVDRDDNAILKGMPTRHV